MTGVRVVVGEGEDLGPAQAHLVVHAGMDQGSVRPSGRRVAGASRRWRGWPRSRSTDAVVRPRCRKRPRLRVRAPHAPDRCHAAGATRPNRPAAACEHCRCGIAKPGGGAEREIVVRRENPLRSAVRARVDDAGPPASRGRSDARSAWRFIAVLRARATLCSLAAASASALRPISRDGRCSGQHVAVLAHAGTGFERRSTRTVVRSLLRANMPEVSSTTERRRRCVAARSRHRLRSDPTLVARSIRPSRQGWVGHIASI